MGQIDDCLNCSLPICNEDDPNCAFVQITRSVKTGTSDYKAHRNLDNYRAYQREYQRERYRANKGVRERKKLTSKWYRERTYVPVKLRADLGR